MNRSITMTAEQTAIYDNGPEEQQRELIAALRQQAQALREETGAAVEIYTADGIVADVVGG